jgi:hypothetical protein
MAIEALKRVKTRQAARMIFIVVGSPFRSTTSWCNPVMRMLGG